MNSGKKERVCETLNVRSHQVTHQRVSPTNKKTITKSISTVLIIIRPYCLFFFLVFAIVFVCVCTFLHVGMNGHTRISIEQICW